MSKIMTRSEFREFLLNEEIHQITVVRCPDYNGGYQYGIDINLDLDSSIEELGPYQYIEAHYKDATSILRNKNSIFEEWYEPFHSDPYGVERTLEDLLMERLGLVEK